MTLRGRSGFDLSIQSVNQIRPVQCFLDEDLASVVEDSMSKRDPWRDDSPQHKKLSLAPKRLREDDSQSQLSAMGDLLPEQSYIDTNIVLKSINL